MPPVGGPPIVGATGGTPIGPPMPGCIPCTPCPFGYLAYGSGIPLGGLGPPPPPGPAGAVPGGGKPHGPDEGRIGGRCAGR